MADTSRRTVSRRSFLKKTAAASAGVAFSGSLASRAEAAQAERPNIILILADDMGFSDLGCYGGEIETPNLDRLANEGLRFTQFYNGAVCCPTRASLLTGLYSHQAGVGAMSDDYELPGYRGFLNDRCVTIAELLATGGYDTHMVGKWHVGAAEGQWPIDRGFKRTYSVPQGGGLYFWPSPQRKRDISLNGQVIDPTKEKYYDGRQKWYSTDAFTDYANRFIRESHSAGQPFFLYAAYIAPHYPLQARAEDIAKYRGKYMKGWEAFRAQRYARLKESGLLNSGWSLSPPDAVIPKWAAVDNKEEMDLRMAIYAAQIDAMDQNIGRMMGTLEELGIKENTLVLFLSDNGGGEAGGPGGFSRGPDDAPIGTQKSWASYGQAWGNVSDTPFRKYKKWTHEGGISTPCIASWPRGINQPGGIMREPCHVMDLMPTCLDLAGVEYPSSYDGRPVLPPEGRSFSPALRGESPESHSALFWEFRDHRAVRAGRWKLVAGPGQAWELYDIEADRTELDNLSSRHAEKVRQLERRYHDWADRCHVLPWQRVQQLSN